MNGPVKGIIKNRVTIFPRFLMLLSFVCVGTCFTLIASSSDNFESQAAIMSGGIEVPVSPSNPAGQLPAQYVSQPQFYPTNNEATICEQTPGCNWIDGRCKCPIASNLNLGLDNKTAYSVQSDQEYPDLVKHDSDTTGTVDSNIDTVTLIASAIGLKGYTVSQWGQPDYLQFVHHSTEAVTTDDQSITTTYKCIKPGSDLTLMLRVGYRDSSGWHSVKDVSEKCTCSLGDVVSSGPQDLSETTSDTIGTVCSESDALSNILCDTVNINARAINLKGYTVSQWGQPGYLQYVSRTAPSITEDDQTIGVSYKCIKPGSDLTLMLRVGYRDSSGWHSVIKDVTKKCSCLSEDQTEPNAAGKYKINVSFMPGGPGLRTPNIAVYLMDGMEKGRTVSTSGFGILDAGRGVVQISIDDVPFGSNVKLGADLCAIYKFHGENTFNFDGVPGYKGDIILISTSYC